MGKTFLWFAVRFPGVLFTVFARWLLGEESSFVA
jgi:hypothetical protein